MNAHTVQSTTQNNQPTPTKLNKGTLFINQDKIVGYQKSNLKAMSSHDLKQRVIKVGELFWKEKKAEMKSILAQEHEDIRIELAVRKRKSENTYTEECGHDRWLGLQ